VPGQLTLRPIQPEDDPFLREVYASTRAEELTLVNWSATEREAFLRMQFDAQHRHYQTQFPAAEFNVILQDGQPVGRIYLLRSNEEFRVIDVALLPEHRHHGIGTALLRNFLAEAEAAGKPARLRVERFNPARRLYERMGFSLQSEDPIYLSLEKYGTS